jgi:WD40 repeat protein
VFSPDGKCLVTAGRGDGHGVFQVWDIRTGMSVLLRADDDKQSTFYCIAINSTGKIIATGGPPDMGIKLWDFATGQFVRQFKGHKDEIDSLSFSPDGKMLASASHDKTVMIWTLEPNGGQHATR